jgi:hypothetical protein
MPAQIGRFFEDSFGPESPRSSLLGLLGRSVFRHHPQKAGLRPAHTAIQYRRGTTCTGELDGAKETDGG